MGLEVVNTPPLVKFNALPVLPRGNDQPRVYGKSRNCVPNTSSLYTNVADGLASAMACTLSLVATPKTSVTTTVNCSPSSPSMTSLSKRLPDKPLTLTATVFPVTVAVPVNPGAPS